MAGPGPKKRDSHEGHRDDEAGQARPDRCGSSRERAGERINYTVDENGRTRKAPMSEDLSRLFLLRSRLGEPERNRVRKTGCLFRCSSPHAYQRTPDRGSHRYPIGASRNEDDVIILRREGRSASMSRRVPRNDWWF